MKSNNIMKKNKIYKAFITAGLISLSNYAAAEDVNQAEVNKTENAKIEVIMITSQKRVQNVQEVGIAVQAFNAEDLERMGVEDIRDLGRLAAGVEFTGGSNGVDPFVVIRGVSMQATGPANAPANSVHVDEVPYSRSQFLNFPAFDLERAEILKGPQGTLFGLGATGGTVNLITKKPSEDTDGYVDLSYSTFNTFDLTAAGNVELGDNTSGRIAVKLQKSDGHMKSIGTTNVDEANFQPFYDSIDFTDPIDKGYIVQADVEPGGYVYEGYQALIADQPDVAADDNYGGLNKVAIRASVKSQLADNVEMLAQVSFFNDDSEIIQRELEGVNSTYFDANGDPIVDRMGNLQPQTPFTIAHNIVDSTYDHQQFGATLRFDIDLDNDMTLTSLTGFNRLHRVVRDNTDTTALPAQEQTMVTDDQVITQEIRFTGKTDNAFWTAGLFFMNDQLSAVVDTPYPIKSKNDFLGTFYTEYTEDVSTWGLFANIEYDLTDTVSLIAGVRQNDENRQYAVEAYDSNIYDIFDDKSGDSIMDQNRGFPISESPFVDESSFTYKLGANWKAYENAMLYVNYSTGKSAAGFDGSAVTGIGEATIPTEGEEVKSLELGFKTSGDAFRFNGAFYAMDYDDMRISRQELLSGSVAEGTASYGGVLANAGKAEIRGAEFELQWVPVDYFGIDSTLNLMSAEIIEYEGGDKDTAESIAAIEGSKVPDAPDLTYRVGLWTEHEIANYTLYASLDYVFRDEAYTRTVKEDPKKLMDSYALVNARVNLTPSSEDWSVSLWVKNLTDEMYATALDSSEGGNGYRRITRGMPRTFGIDFRYNFF